MPGFLKQSTASQSRAIGPFIDDTDFKTPETALTIANTDIKLITNGGASANKNSGGGTHRANGVYGITFDATDTATVGEIEISVVVAGALPVFDKFFVLEEAVYAALFEASSPGYLQPTVAGRTLDVSATGEAGLDWANIGSPTTAVNLSGTNIDVDQVVASVSGNVGGNVTGSVGTVNALAANVITAAATAADFGTEVGTAVWATTTRILTAGTNIALAKGTGVTGFTDIDAAGVRTAVGLASANLDTQLAALPTDADVSAAVWNAATASYGTAGTYGLLVETNLDAAITSRMATYTQPTGFLAATFPGTVASTTNITAGTITTVTNLTNAPTSGDLTATMKASVSAAVWDAATASYGTAGTYGLLVETNLDATVSSRSTLTQTQVTGGAYSVQSASCVLGDARIANLDAAVSTRMATYTQPTGFLAATFPGGTIANTTNITAGTITTATNVTTVNGLAADTITSTALAASAVTEIQSGLATAAALTTVDTVVDAVKVVTDKLDTALVLDGAVYQYTANALELGPSGGLDAAGVRAAIGLASANLDTQLAALPTAIENADELLTRDWTSVSVAGTTRCVLTALYPLRNKVDVPNGDIYESDDTTVAWSFTTTTDVSAEPITVIDPT